MFDLDITLDIVLLVIGVIFAISSAISIILFPIFLSEAIKWLKNPWITVYKTPFIKGGEDDDT